MHPATLYDNKKLMSGRKNKNILQFQKPLICIVARRGGFFSSSQLRVHVTKPA